MIYYSWPLLGLLRERLAALGLRLSAWLGRVRVSLAELIGVTIGEAAEAAIRAVLGPRRPQPQPPHLDPRWDAEEDWDEEPPPYRHYRQDEPEDDWRERREPQPRLTPGWLHSLLTKLRTLLRWLHQQPGQRPLLTALALSAGAGLAALVVGPLLAWVALTVVALLISVAAREALARLLGLSR